MKLKAYVVNFKPNKYTYVKRKPKANVLPKPK